MWRLFISITSRIAANDGQNLLHACLSLGFDLPYFCWHPAMGSVGACRQCAVKQFKDEKDTHGKLVMACMTPAADGTRISSMTRRRGEFRASVAEWMMVHHPHDCPVCDEGGECHLQDMTVMNGHAYRRYRGREADFPQPGSGSVRESRDEPLYPVLPLRPILSGLRGRPRPRCAGSARPRLLRPARGRHPRERVQRQSGRGLSDWRLHRQDFQAPLHSQMGPTDGAVRLRALRIGLQHHSRRALRDLRRIHTRFNGEVNGYFLCDRGRYGYEFVNSGRRMRHPAIRRVKNEPLQPVARQEALRHLDGILSKADGVVGIGSPVLRSRPILHFARWLGRPDSTQA